MVLFQEALLSDKWQKILSSFERFGWGFFRGFQFSGTEISSGVMIGSRYEMQSHHIHSTADREPILRTAKSSGLSYFPIAGRTDQLLVINTHAMNFNFGQPFRSQIEATVRMIEGHVGPMIWAGDFNTWSKGRRSFLK
jgi:endonuclease/exonuclease/phosphatase (EEP) superfamily protein YafD